MKIKIYRDDGPRGTTIAIGGDAPDLRELGKKFLEAQEFTIITEKRISKYWPITMERLSFCPSAKAEAFLDICIQEQKLLLSGGSGVAQKLGQSLLNFFGGEVAVGTHFHLSYFEGNGLLNPTDCELIFQCDP